MGTQISVFTPLTWVKRAFTEMYCRSTQERRQHQLLGMMVAVLTVGVLAVGVIPGTAAADHANDTADRIQIVDAYPQDGNTVVAVQATTDEQVGDLQFIQDGGSVLNFSNAGIVGAQYDNRTTFGSSDTFSADSGRNGVVTFTLSESWNTGEFQLNASADRTAYDTAGRANRSVLTANAYNMSLVNASGGPVTTMTPTALINSSSGHLHSYAFVRKGQHVFHCGGVVDGTTCTDPDTDGKAHTYSQRSSRQRPTPLPADSLTVKAFQLSTANGSASTALSPGDTTVSVDEAAAPVMYEATDYSGQYLSNVSEVRITNRTSGETVLKKDPSVTAGPLFVAPKTDYEVVIERPGETARRPTMFPTKGLTNKQIRIAGDSPPPTQQVIGIVRNESGMPVENAIVTAEPANSQSDPPSVNSTTTDENGLFSMQLPESNAVDYRYQFQVASSQTTDNTLEYFPTRDDGNGDGYNVRDSRTILPPLEIKHGGEVDISVTNASGGTLGPSRALTSLSQTTTKTGDRTRDSLVESFNLFSFLQNSPTETVVRVPSPTTRSPKDDVSYNVWGLGGLEGPSRICAEQTDVSQGDRTNADCALEQAGTLNITLGQYENIVDPSGASKTVTIGDPWQLQQNALIVRNATSGNVSTFLGPGSIQQYFLRNQDSSSLSVPVPAGNYTVELRPVAQHVDRTAVRNTTAVSVAADQTTDVPLKSGRDFVIDADPSRTDFTLSRVENNSFGIVVADPVDYNLLNGSDVDVSLQLLHRNGTVASSTVQLAENTSATDPVFENDSFSPDVGAGEYTVEVTVTHTDGASSYTTTIREQLKVSDFETDLWTRQRTVAPGKSFDLNIQAYNTTAEPAVPIDADSTNITLYLFDEDENPIDRNTADNDIVDGEGTIDIGGLPDPGTYKLSAIVEADDGTQGVADTWITVSGYELDVDLNRSVYGPNSSVGATVTLTNRSGDPVEGATLETTVETETETVSFTNTSSNGPTAIDFDPKDDLNGTLDSETDITVRSTIDTGDNILTVSDTQSVAVRSFQADVSTTNRQYAASENPTLNVFVPSNVDVDSVAAVELNGKEINQTGTQVDPGFYQVTLDESASSYELANGTNKVRVEVTNTNGRSETDTTRFKISSQNIHVETAARKYSTGEDITVTATVRRSDGSPVSGAAVEMRITEERKPNPVNKTTASTNADGVAEETFTPGSTGIHEVSVRVDGSTDTRTILISDLDAVFTDGSTPVESYEFTPGDSEAINITAANQTGGINGEMTVRTLVDGEVKTLGEEGANVTGGTGGVSFTAPDANTGSYPLQVLVESESGAFTTNVTRMELTAGEKTVSLKTDVEKTVYAPGDTATMQAEVTNGSGPIAGQTVGFTLVSSSTEIDLGSKSTGEDGRVTLDASVPSNLTSGEYGVRARLPEQGTTEYDGIYVSDMQLSLETNESAYAAGENVTVNLTATTDGSPVSGAEGGVRIRFDGTEVTKSFDSTGESPYQVEIELPDNDAIVGSRTVEGFVRNGSSVATASTSIDVFNPSEDADLSVPETIIADENEFTITANATVDTKGSIAVYSPGAGSAVYEDELNLNESTALSLSDPGTYVFRLSVPGVGTETVVRNVDSGPNDPEVRVGPDLSTNATAFNTSEEIVIRTEADDMTATVFSQNDRDTLTLNRKQNGRYYSTLSASETTTGPYLVRLDGPNSTDVDSVLIEVTN